MSDIFLSYARGDRERVLPLVEALQHCGFSVWWDADMPPGQLFEDYIDQRLQESRCVVVVWTESSIRSDWVRAEAAEGVNRRILLPVLLDAVRPPLTSRGLQAADLTKWKANPTHAGFVQLCEAIHRLIDGVPPVPTPSSPSPTTVVSRLHARRAPGWVASVGLAIMLVSGALWWFAAHRGGDLVVGVMEIAVRGFDDDWRAPLARDKLSAILNRFKGIRVIAKEQIDLIRARDQVREIEAAQVLGIDKMITGTLFKSGVDLKLQLNVVDLYQRGSQRSVREVPGSDAQLERMVNLAAVEVIKVLGPGIAGDIDEILRLSSGGRTADYRLLAETMGSDDEEPAPSSVPAPESRGFSLVNSAWASDGDEASARSLLERYRVALEAKDLTTLATLHVDLTTRMRAALEQYFANAEALRVQFSDVSLLFNGDEALASFTRRDEFRDAGTGQPVTLEIRVSSTLTRQDGAWRIKGLKRPPT